MNWTQAVCTDCWHKRNPNEAPTRVKNAPIESCCYCGKACCSGIYIRVDPTSVPFPSETNSTIKQPT